MNSVDPPALLHVPIQQCPPAARLCAQKAVTVNLDLYSAALTVCLPRGVAALTMEDTTWLGRVSGKEHIASSSADARAPLMLLSAPAPLVDLEKSVGLRRAFMGVTHCPVAPVGLPSFSTIPPLTDGVMISRAPANTSLQNCAGPLLLYPSFEWS